MRLKSDHSLLIWTDVSHNSKKRDSLWKFPNKLLKELKFVKWMKKRINSTRQMNFKDATEKWKHFINRFIKENEVVISTNATGYYIDSLDNHLSFSNQRLKKS